MNILLIEDDQRIALLIKRGLEEQAFTVVVAHDGETGKELALANAYEMIITDVILPGISGLELCKAVRLQKPAIPILMLTALGTTDDTVEGFDAGADDYLVKPFELRELYARILALLKRNKSDVRIRGVLLKYADLEINLYTRIIKRGGKPISLTPKELKLLEYMMQNPERVLSRGEIAEKVWETTFYSGTNFIDVYINYLRKKIDRDFEIKLIHTKPGIGFILSALL